MIVIAELITHPSTKCRTGFAKIDGNIEHSSTYHTDKLSLRLLDLIMQTTQHPVCGSRLIILEELHIRFDLAAEGTRVPGLQEEASIHPEPDTSKLE
jgi:hypothetical protein